MEEIKKSESVVILDIRSQEIFEHFHVSYAIWTNTKSEIDTRMNKQKVFVICQRGVSSLAFAQQLRDQGVEAYSVTGGTIKWSYDDLPRVRDEVCILNHSN